MKIKKTSTSNLLQKTQEENLRKKQRLRLKEKNGITLIALVVTTIFFYDEKLKCSNYNGFLLETI